MSIYSLPGCARLPALDSCSQGGSLRDIAQNLTGWRRFFVLLGL